MPNLYLANCTKQRQIIYYRLDFDAEGAQNVLRRFQPAKQSPIIPPGRQIALGGELYDAQIKDIVGQLSKYGMLEYKDAARLPPNIVPYIYSVGVPVQTRAIELVLAHNSGVLSEQGRIRREQAAIAAKESLTAEAETIDVKPTAFEASIEQEEAGADGQKTIDEGYRVMNEVSDVPDRVRTTAVKRKYTRRAP